MAASSPCTLCGNVGSLPLLHPSPGKPLHQQRQQQRQPKSGTALAVHVGSIPGPSCSQVKSAMSHSHFFGRGLRQGMKQSASRNAGRQILTGQAVAEVEFVNSGEDAKKLVDEGYQILDIRDEVQYERAHIPSSVHVPYFITNKDKDIATFVYRQLHFGFSGLFYGLPFTKENRDFTATVRKQIPKDSKILLVCNEGMRSSYAAEKLENDGYENLAFLSTGLSTVEPGIFPKVGKAELKDSGKGGLVTIQQPVSFVLGTILILAYLFLQFFPDQATELFFKT